MGKGGTGFHVEKNRRKKKKIDAVFGATSETSLKR